MKMRLRALSCPTGIIAVLLITAPQVGRAATEAIDPNSSGNVQLTAGSFELTSNPFTLSVQQNLASDIDNRSILEFPLASVPANPAFTAAMLQLEVTVFMGSGGNFPAVTVFGYSGDGVAAVNDATVTANLLGVSNPITQSGSISIGLDLGYITGLVGNATHLGLLLMGSANGLPVSFDNIGIKPVLNLTLVDPGDFDLDGDVDGIDFLKWQRGESTTPFSASDLMDWETNYGTNPLVASIATVPETATFGLALLSVLGMLAKRSPARHCIAANSAFCKPNSAIVSA